MDMDEDRIIIFLTKFSRFCPVSEIFDKLLNIGPLGSIT